MFNYRLNNFHFAQESLTAMTFPIISVNPTDCGVGQPRSHELIHMGFLRFLFNLINNGANQPIQSSQYSGSSASYRRGQSSPSSSSRTASYNRIIAMVGSTGMSESALKSELVDKYSFNQGDVDLLVASPTFRQLMGWI